MYQTYAVIVVIIILFIGVIYWYKTSESFGGDDASLSSITITQYVDDKVKTILTFMRGSMKNAGDVHAQRVQSLEAAKQAVETSLSASEDKVAALSIERDSLQAKVDALSQSGNASTEELASLNAEITAIGNTINILMDTIDKYKISTSSMSCSGTQDNVVDTLSLEKEQCWNTCSEDPNCNYATHDSINNNCVMNYGYPDKCTYESTQSMYISSNNAHNI